MGGETSKWPQAPRAAASKLLDFLKTFVLQWALATIHLYHDRTGVA